MKEDITMSIGLVMSKGTEILGWRRRIDLGHPGNSHCSNNQSNHQLNFPDIFSPDIAYI